MIVHFYLLVHVIHLFCPTHQFCYVGTHCTHRYYKEIQCRCLPSIHMKNHIVHQFIVLFISFWIRCELCHVRCASARLLARHLNNAHQQKRLMLSCKYCDKHTFRSKMLLYKHLRTFHPNNATVQLFGYGIYIYYI